MGETDCCNTDLRYQSFFLMCSQLIALIDSMYVFLFQLMKDFDSAWLIPLYLLFTCIRLFWDRQWECFIVFWH